ncbi:MAG: hypothetical protein A3F13_06510 [Gammaproteobacteria bacterium RIFCSPHIGHO2_12_FULL_40_19]|nr:MAG: hypothetical protein A3F13_06510 [Gammaproteobacteria bacterium RIFCSPHIGHO2_12_FULL_40_19]
MSEHLMIYLDESGDLGFDFSNKKPSRYFTIALLICFDREANKTTIQSVKKTLRNKLPKNAAELKGSNLAIAIKKYFLKEMKKVENWCLYLAVADKKTWIEHHNNNHAHSLKSNTFYDEVAKRVFSQVDYLETAKNVDVIVDRSKSKDHIVAFNSAITDAIKKRLPKTAKLSIRHAYSHEEAGLQAVDLFCAGAWRKHEKLDIAWYTEFSDKIAGEMIYKF